MAQSLDLGNNIVRAVRLSRINGHCTYNPLVETLGSTKGKRRPGLVQRDPYVTRIFGVRDACELG